jgi:hypothetical protein
MVCHLPENRLSALLCLPAGYPQAAAPPLPQESSGLVRSCFSTLSLHLESSFSQKRISNGLYIAISPSNIFKKGKDGREVSLN